MGKLEKLLAPKFDYLCKQYFSRKKTIFPMPNVPKGTLYYLKNEVFCFSRNEESVLDMVMQGVAHEG
jgi:hypothetical protein